MNACRYQPYPLWDRSVLFAFFSEDPLNPECFQGRHDSTLQDIPQIFALHLFFKYCQTT